jgi:hypothetical protein
MDEGKNEGGIFSSPRGVLAASSNFFFSIHKKKTSLPFLMASRATLYPVKPPWSCNFMSRLRR